jgi:hypothetical protein
MESLDQDAEGNRPQGIELHLKIDGSEMGAFTREQLARNQPGVAGHADGKAGDGRPQADAST